ncbi:NADP oxidoreductase [Psychromonas sp. MB-3u-54]|uniref:NAD(P)H-dependent oxidoreductase subunit E n=1 Tax=Psychromonas sp. MB-3u-54 TaxID=2058319 RepID=UPI000C34722C|nr:NAD(P)H-dependent oxidoreductase subunit E [Psychromonas sp. MB-3u-54]PKH02801.1 NADP oxidoreductase [Psychromonas sp. MB-3u-54]
MNKALAALIHQQVKVYRGDATYLLQILRHIQFFCSHIPEQAIQLLSFELKISIPKIRALIEFYHFLHYQPRGDYDIYISDSIIDHMSGKNEITSYLCEKLKVKLNQPRADGRVTVANTSCTGMSDQGPAVLVNGLALTRLSRKKVGQMVAKIEGKIAVEAWPKSWFNVADNIQSKGVLLNSEIKPGEAIKKALAADPHDSLTEIDKSGLRGCGGAGFKTAEKWKSCLLSDDNRRYVVCNADEGEPGTFKDRVLLNSYAEQLIEGMTLCAYIIGAQKGIIYLRYEYQHLHKKLQETLQTRRAANLLGTHILNTELSFDIEIFMGAGSYVCGEESALLESLEGRRAIPRIRPPYPVTHGYLGKPTVINNVETFCYAALIIEKGADNFAQQGLAGFSGCKILSISGDVEKAGIYEIPLGMPVKNVLNLCGAQSVQAVQVGGPSGALIIPAEFSRVISFDSLNTGGSFMVFNHSRDILENALNFTHFFMQESCGFCTPCRVGTKLICDLADKVATGQGARLDLDSIKQLNHVMNEMSHCGLGQRAAHPLLETLEKFPEYFVKRMTDVEYQPSFDVEKSIQRAIDIVTIESN